MSLRPPLTALALAALLGVTATAFAQDPGDGYLCCNMRTDGAWISDSNYMESGKTMIPFGTPVKFAGYGRYRVHVDVNGKRQAIGNDYSRDVAMDAFARRYIVAEDPRARVARLPAKIRGAIESSRVTRGMTRDQVLMSLGYPISSENPHLDAPNWKYWLWSFSPYTVHFGPNGLVARVETDPETLGKIWVD